MVTKTGDSISRSGLWWGSHAAAHTNAAIFRESSVTDELGFERRVSSGRLAALLPVYGMISMPFTKAFPARPGVNLIVMVPPSGVAGKSFTTAL